MLNLRIKIVLTRLMVYLFKRLNFLPPLLKNKLAQYISNKTFEITKEMYQKQIL